MLQGRMGTQITTDFETIPVGHDQIDQHHVRHDFAGKSTAILPLGGQNHVETGNLQNIREEFTILRIIVDNQDRRTHNSPGKALFHRRTPGISD